MLEMILTMVAVIWIVIGLGYIALTPSRGFVADALFVVLWPVHWVRRRLGYE